MSIATNLEKIETDITNAYSAVSTKGGTIPANKNTNNLEAAINSIPSGGGSAVSDDVIFYDYDGTIVDSYSASDFANLQAMPQNPSHTGLTAQGWNWSLADAKTYVANHGKLNIGQMYTTDDEKTRIYIHLEDGRLSPYLGFAVNGSATIEWGDGTSETVTGTSVDTNVYTQHNYANAGDYIIKLSSSNKIYLRGNSYRSYLLIKNNNIKNEDWVYLTCIKKVELSSNISIEDSAFGQCHSLASITIPSGITTIGTYAFGTCYLLTNITIPSGLTTIGSYAFSNCTLLTNVILPSGLTTISERAFFSCHSLASITIPSGLTTIDTYAFGNCSSLTNIILPNSVTTIGTYAFSSCPSLTNITIPSEIKEISDSVFSGCYSLTSITLPNGLLRIYSSAFSNCTSLTNIILPSSVIYIYSSAFYNCYSLTNIKIPSGVKKVESNVFANCYGMSFYDFTARTSVPTLSYTNAFYNIPSDCKIIVRDNLYDTWVAATNWSNYASYIVRESDYNV